MSTKDKPTYEELELDHAVLYEQYKRLAGELSKVEELYMDSQDLISKALNVLSNKE